MDTDYDRKFEEMKKYIPFLQSMIKRLESGGSTAENPRQAQLAKIRSLRDLLSDKKKRMKMENLLKCEQVLINLYAKVEQRDSFSDARHDTDASVNSNKVQLDFARNKLKYVTSHLHDSETLPENAQACKTEDVCTAGSKEPMSIQRRPNMISISPIRGPVPDNNKFTATPSKRSYTRVLVSPERDPDGRPRNRTSHKPIFSRRSPLRSPKKSTLNQSASHNRKDKKMDNSYSQDTSEQLKDLNITLKVPEESLSSLNTKDILSRIINCSDNDVDIETLRGLRTQILSELKQTGTKDDISDLILKSYKNKKSNEKKRAEVEEGELSDSESEVIESVYGSLVVVDNDNSNVKDEKKLNENEQQPRKIQICLVINSEKEDNNAMNSPKDSSSHNTLYDESDFEPFRGSKEIDVDNKKTELKELKDIKKNVLCNVESEESLDSETRKRQRNEVEIGKAQQTLILKEKIQQYDVQVEKLQLSNANDEASKVMSSEVAAVEVQAVKVQTNEVQSVKVQTGVFEVDEVQGGEVQVKENDSGEIGGIEICTANKQTENSKEIEKANNSQGNLPNTSNKMELSTNTEIQLQKVFSPNLYKPILNQDGSNDIADSASKVPVNIKQEEENEYNKNENCSKLKDPVDIPLLDFEATAKQEVVHEIDILQALKKEILSEKISLSNPDIVTPPLHQPKLTKVENLQTMLPKKRISIERYKEKSTSAPRSSLFINDVNSNTTKEELLKKQSLKLTEKEYERFNLSGEIAINESSDEEDKGKISPIDDIYNNLAPKSPDHEDFADTGIKPPVIIPADPVKTTAVSSKTDVDMRMTSLLPSTNSAKVRSKAPSPSANIDKAFDVPKNEAELNVNDKRLPLVDPRMKRDFNFPNMESPNLGFVEHAPRPPINFSSNMTPILMPNSMSNMTPNRIPQPSNVISNMVSNVTTNANVYDISSSRQSFESDSYSNQSHVYAPTFPIHDTHDYNDDVKARDVLRNNSEFQNMYVENNNSPIYNLSECPQTPVHPFGVSECPPNPNHSFARLETPMTPIHSFGRSDAPMTPIHHFGRSECPSTPSHQFSRTEVLMTPTHPFGRNEFSKNQSQIPPIRYNNFQDPRMSRSSDYNNMSPYNDENNYDNYNERISSNFNTRNYKYDPSKRNYNDSYRSYGRQKSVGRYDNRSAAYEQESRYGERSSRHESNIGHSSSRSNKSDRHYCNDRSKGYRQRDYRYENDSARNYNDPCGLRRNYRREHSMVRSEDRYIERNNDSIFKSDKTLSVHSLAGRSFTIDTSVNRSFQENLSNHGNASLSEPNFDARRKRASSVGRFLTKEPTAGNISDLENKNRSLGLQNKFRRACSVGRDSVNNNATKNFLDIKEELQAFKNTGVEKVNSNVPSIPRSTGVIKKGNERDPRLSRREQYDIQNSKNERHLTCARRENSRESNFRGEANKDYQKKYYDSTKEKSQEIQKHGIIYSTDNIAKGTILGLGYGVKNYKIPKIKKPTDEMANQDVTENVTTFDNKTMNNTCGEKNTVENREANPVKQECSVVKVEKSLNKENEIVEHDKINLKEESVISENLESGSKSKDENKTINLNTSNNIEKRVTRSAKRSTISETNIKDCENPRKKITKSMNLGIHVSESDDDDIPVINFNKKYHNKASKESINAVLTPTVDETNNLSLNSEIKTNINVDYIGDDVNNEILKTDEPESSESLVFNDDSNILDSDNCFGIGLEMFSENIATDPVIENINALIADLDDDLETSKNDGTKNQFTKEINLENMLDNITCVDKKDTGSSNNETKNFTETVDINPIINETSLDRNLLNNKQVEKAYLCVDMKMEHNNEVTTTDQEMPLVLPKSTIQKSLVSCSIPDSTIDVNMNTQKETDNAKGNEEVPDSTDELICQINTDVTSTYNSCEARDTVKTSSSRELQQQSDSIGSLLSILKDKSRIKELLSMLKDQSSENEKLKKKLEKLSEIVSDDDDDDKQTPNDMSRLSHTHNNILSKDDEVEVHQSKVSAVNNLSKDPVVVHSNKIVNTQVDKEIDSFNTSNCFNSSLSSQLNSLKAENIEEVIKIKGKEISKDLESSENENKIRDDDKFEEIQVNSIESEQSETPKKALTKNTKFIKGKARVKNNNIDDNKRFTRSESIGVKTGKACGGKIPSRELKQLQEDIKEMFMHDDIFNATGIRMCRLAKLVEDKTQSAKGEQLNVENTSAASGETSKGKNSRKKNVSKSKVLQKNASVDMENSTENSLTESKIATKCKSGPRSKTKVRDQYEVVDPYMFESDSVSESNHTNLSEIKFDTTSESECDSLGSSRSFESTEQITEIKKKPKRKRRGWQAGVIKPKQKKRKAEMSNGEKESSSSEKLPQGDFDIPDSTCFTDKTYCFSKNVTSYSCRFCPYDGNEIVHHYKKQHPHLEIPLSRMSPEVAKEAIEQSEEINTTAISKISTDKYTCRFCFKEFSRKKTILEAFFWHVVSAHTGEYKQLCSECTNIKRCPFDLDIPPPPKELKGQLLGFICGKCNFTQVSLENLKSHVITRHNNEQTEVSVINLAMITKKVLLTFIKSTAESEPRRSRRLVQTMKVVKGEVDTNTSSELLTEIETSKTNINRMKSQIIFENDDDENDKCELNKTPNIKFEPEEETVLENISQLEQTLTIQSELQAPVEQSAESAAVVSDIVAGDCYEPTGSNDVLDYPHFKISHTKTGTTEYVCCINGVENHYITPLLISFKKHVQIKHKEKWDGFCFLCKLIVTPLGDHSFKDCLQHFLEKHIDEFPLMEKEDTQQEDTDNGTLVQVNDAIQSKSYVNVRPLSELVSQSPPPHLEPTLPVIESVISLGAPQESVSSFHLDELGESEINNKKDVNKYEVAQAQIMSQKHNVVLEIMMSHEKLVNLFKCAGRFCSYSSDSAEDALRHALVHERIGGENALICAYCGFDSLNNSVDLVTHVFKFHGGCQFACSQCFYRAAASQLVHAHVLRKHADPAAQCLILRSTVSLTSVLPDTILPREVAVPFYVCNQLVNGERCKFKTYTLGKFCEHYRSRHAADGEYWCYCCSDGFPQYVGLLQHMKDHGFKLYQCTWCVHGADNETELLAHASEEHPNKQPQAYLRVITNKEGALGYRVLPLAQLNQSKIPTVDVTPSTIKGNPEREAERSIDLQKLIDQTSRMITESTSPPHTQGSSVRNDAHCDAFGMPFNCEPSAQSEDSLVLALQASLLEETQELSAHSSADLHRSETPVLIEQPAESDVHKQLTPILKIKPEQKTHKNFNENEIVCLDSDDEQSNQTVDFSDHDPPSTVDQTKSEDLNLVPTSILYKCGLCEEAVFDNATGYTRHVTALHAQVPQLPCAHCSFRGTKAAIINHYNSDHSVNETRRYTCGVCYNKYVSLVFVKRHIREAHNFAKVVVTSKTVTNGKHQFIVGQVGKNKKTSKRKRANEPEEKTSQPAPKVKKFSPDDLNMLPINPILDDLVYCALCEFGTKVRLNMVRHLQQHAEQQPVPQTAPVNPVPHLETNEKHFDKMLNLASSSIASRMDKSNRCEQQSGAGDLVPPEAAAQYPKHVPDRQRYTCGAKGCCYISVDEVMLKYHWETLHSDTNEFHCVHCPPYQHLDISKPLTASRIIAHLKMHDARLYACSCCPYYNHRRQGVEKHISEYHSSGHVMVVREDSTASAANALSTSAATPTMDLKPWQCGLCKFKSMLRAEVVEHCAKIHQSKMQYKCMYCAFRTSTLESVQKHQRNAHPDRALETFYFYYREGSIPDEVDGSPRWQKQSGNSGLTETRVKSEAIECTESELQSKSSETDPPSQTVTAVDLNIVKRDPDAVDAPERTMEDLCKSFGQFCEPNGLKYKCPLCKIVSEESKEAMQSHLYEELQYRKWECGFCSYRAFHKNGLNEHMLTEHRQNRDPIELPVDLRVETWIANALDHQFLLIEKNKQNLTKQRMPPGLIPSPPASRSVSAGPAPAKKYAIKDLENSFGKFGAPDDLCYSCPKCNVQIRQENVMRDHLEMELNKIRWCCNSCPEKFQNYHEAQFHCKTAHAGPAGSAARAVEAVRDMGMRSAWISAVVESQKLSMSNLSAQGADTAEVLRQSSALDNSLLVVRYEERVPTPEMQAHSLRPPSLDSDEDEKLVIDEPSPNSSRMCPFCKSVSKDLKHFKDHVSHHDNIKPYFCASCDFNSYRKAVLKHIAVEHAGQSVRLLTKAQRSRGPPLRSSAPVAMAATASAIVTAATMATISTAAPVATVAPAATVSTAATITVSAFEDDSAKLVCLNCEKTFTEHEAKNHTHEYATPAFAKKGQVVVKCCICLRLQESMDAAIAHHRACHPADSLNYAYYKLHHNKRSLFCCGYCEQHFKFWRDLKVHWKATHDTLPLQFSKRLFGGASSDAVSSLSDDDEVVGKRKSDGVPEGGARRMCARKSTTKLPYKAVAKKSTTKLPYHSEPELSEYSFYGTRPPAHDLNDVRTRLTFGCTDVSFSFKQLSEVIKINPAVLVEDIKK